MAMKVFIVLLRMEAVTNQGHTPSTPSNTLSSPRATPGTSSLCPCGMSRHWGTAYVASQANACTAASRTVPCCRQHSPSLARFPGHWTRDPPQGSRLRPPHKGNLQLCPKKCPVHLNLFMCARARPQPYCTGCSPSCYKHPVLAHGISQLKRSLCTLGHIGGTLLPWCSCPARLWLLGVLLADRAHPSQLGMPGRGLWLHVPCWGGAGSPVWPGATGWHVAGLQVPICIPPSPLAIQTSPKELRAALHGLACWDPRGEAAVVPSTGGNLCPFPTVVEAEASPPQPVHLCLLYSKAVLGLSGQPQGWSDPSRRQGGYCTNPAGIYS